MRAILPVGILILAMAFWPLIPFVAILIGGALAIFLLALFGATFLYMLKQRLTRPRLASPAGTP